MCRSLTARATCWQKYVSTCCNRSRIAALRPLLAQSGHPDRPDLCPLLGVKRTCRGPVVRVLADNQASCGRAAMLSVLVGFVGIVGIADPCISSEPLMHRIAMWTVGLAEKNGARAESCGVNVCTSGNCPPSFRATDHKNTH